jgi:predicted HD superfamily hydrolase involved in NAD metabolism
MPSNNFGQIQQPFYTEDQRKEIARIRQALKVHMAKAKPKRYAHSLSVAKTATSLALMYDVDPYLACCAGLLHDWEKVFDNDQQIASAHELGIDLGVDLSLVGNLLHGPLAARRLPAVFPELPSAVWQAIARHTMGAIDMMPLDMVVFVADGIEPLRAKTPSLERIRHRVGKVSLTSLYWESFVGGIIYVLQGGRYLYPGTLEIYNALVLRHLPNLG